MQIAVIARSGDLRPLGGARAGVPLAGTILRNRICAALMIDGLTDR